MLIRGKTIFNHSIIQSINITMYSLKEHKRLTQYIVLLYILARWSWKWGEGGLEVFTVGGRGGGGQHRQTKSALLQTYIVSSMSGNRKQEF